MSPIERVAFITAFVAVAAIFFVRIPAALHRRQARAACAAAGVGAVGLFCLGSVLPLDDVDTLLGGGNTYYLVMCISATLAFWLMGESAIDDASFRLRNAWPVLVLIVAFSAPFFFIERGPTSPKFSHQQIYQLPMLFMACVYLAGLAAICARLLWKIRRYPIAAYWPIMLGAVLVIAGTATEISASLLDYASKQPSATATSLYLGFTPLFFPGVILVISGIASFGVRRWLRDRHIIASTQALLSVIAEHGITPPPSLPKGETDSEARLMTLWLLVIRLRDAETAGVATLSERNREELGAASQLLHQQLTVPAQAELWSAS